jgi:hypothetical protein
MKIAQKLWINKIKYNYLKSPCLNDFSEGHLEPLNSDLLQFTTQLLRYYGQHAWIIGKSGLLRNQEKIPSGVLTLPQGKGGESAGEVDEAGLCHQECHRTEWTSRENLTSRAK